ncbi:MFS transporter [Nocardioides euryhalodurans]|uniref:MFS transporter n=1 Tax=Nocardioides euryhalodurans TaxID=2518370 RepID=UPI001FC97D90|nr:MFS transporter [Nocardioides euryhalodurans]
MTQTAAPRSALSEPTLAPPARWVAALTLLNLGIYSGWFGPIQVLLAEQAATISPDRKEAVLSLVLGVGAAVSTICNPVFGAFSDRTTLRRGRRLPWVLAGAAGSALSLLVLAAAESVTVMLLGWCAAQVFLNAMYAAAMAAIPDQVPVARRGLIGGLVAIAQTIGIVAGVAIAGLTGSIATGYLATLVVLLLLTLPYALGSRDLALPADHRPPPFAIGSFVRSFWISPREHPDFAWAWITRFLVNLGNYVATLYLLFYVIDGLGVSEDDAPGRVLVLTALYAVATIVTTAVFGHWSDRLGRRKVFVIWSGVVSGVASLILAVGQTWPAAVVAAIVLGCAFGIYTAVDFALITQVLPRAEERAKDLGVINIANALPQVLAPVLAGAILVVVREAGGSVATRGDGWSLGYGTVYLVSFAASVLGSVLVTRIRSVA